MAVLGMRGSGQFGAAERPKNWRQGIMLLFPNGDAPLTAILSKLREQPTDDAQFSWFEKGLPIYRYQITAASATITSQPSATSALTSGTQFALRVGPTGSNNPTPDVTIFKAGHILYDEEHDITMIVVSVQGTGSAAWLVVDTSISANAVSASFPLTPGATEAVADHLNIIGSGFPEGSAIGSAIAYQPVKHFNFTQIFRTPLFLTRTARKTRLRWDTTGPYNEARRESLQLHATEMERAFLFGSRSETTTFTESNADPIFTQSAGPTRTTRGILGWLPPITTATVSVHTDLNQFNASTITEAILDTFMEEAFRYGSREKLGLCGSTALNVLTQLSKNKSTIEAVPTDTTYGMHMIRYLSPFGTLYLVNHPLLSDNPVWRKDLYVIDVDKLTYRYVTDTVFLRNRQAPGDDASKDEFLTEAGLECHFSGATPGGEPSLQGTADPPSPTLIPAPAAHARIKGIATYGG